MRCAVLASVIVLAAAGCAPIPDPIRETCWNFSKLSNGKYTTPVTLSGALVHSLDDSMVRVITEDLLDQNNNVVGSITGLATDGDGFYVQFPAAYDRLRLDFALYIDSPHATLPVDLHDLNGMYLRTEMIQGTPQAQRRTQLIEQQGVALVGVYRHPEGIIERICGLGASRPRASTSATFVEPKR
ncbi:MAG: hypothetical protein NVV74_08810 [Magnetospirillum sp.]|nr:hypothetical protein [Magnetospirillum sp.]